MFPFLSAVNVPVLLAVVTNVCLFDADGFFPPPLTHSYVTASVALQLIVSTEPDASPASLNEQTRFWPLSEALDRFLMKCALPPALATFTATAKAAITSTTGNTTRRGIRDTS